MAHKRPDIYERQSQRHINNFISAKTMAEKYPNVEQITVNMNFKDQDGFKAPEERTITFLSDSRAHFDLDCPYRECIGGGFNLTDIISRMISVGQSELADKLNCQGWQDLERLNKYHCLLELQFKITVQYKK